MSWVSSGVINGVVNEELRAQGRRLERGEPPGVPGELNVGHSFTEMGQTGSSSHIKA